MKNRKNSCCLALLLSAMLMMGLLYVSPAYAADGKLSKSVGNNAVEQVIVQYFKNVDLHQDNDLSDYCDKGFVSFMKNKMEASKLY